MPSATAPSRTGYTFKGYFDQPNGAGVQYYSASMSSLRAWDKASTATLYAHWQANSYTVSFNANSGSGASSSKTAIYDSAMPTITAAPTRTGYIFLGYFDASSGGTKYYNADLSSARLWNKTSNTTLYAHWEAITYTVKFDANGGSGTMADQEFTYGVSNTLTANAFTRTGYTFVCWNTEADGSGTSYGNSASVNNLTTENNGTVVLYAQWRANTYRVSLNEEHKSYTVSFNLNGGSGSIPSQTITETTPLTYPTNPTKNGYIFGVWYLDANCTEQYTFSGVIDSNFTLYARWVSCAINNDSSYPWNLSNGVLTSTNKRDSSSSIYKITAPVALTVSFSYKVSSESNYDFLIIKKNGSELKKISGSTSYVSYSVDLNANDYLTFTYSKDSSQSSGSDCAYISGITYTSKVSYSSTATVPSVNYYDVTFGSSFTLSTDISRTGYTFAGWYDGIGGTGTQYTDAEGHSVRVWDKAENATLYPKWNVNQYTIYFVSNGGSNVDSITQDYGSTVTAPTKPTWNEKSFVGWFTDSSLKNEYRFTTMPAENITLYAKWIEYSVSLSSDETTEISINDVVTSPDTYHATAIDTDGNPVNVVVTVIGGTFEAGKTVTVRLVATGLNGIYATKTISNIKVYGTPTLSYNTEKDYFNLSDTLNAALWNANATDTFGTALRVSVSVKEANYSVGNRVTIVISATDITGNEVKVEIANVKVYGAPTITRDTTKNNMKATDTVGNELFGVSAVDSFGESLTVTTVKQSGTISGGNTITVKSSATDSKGNTHYITYTIKVYDLPTIGGATKTSFKVGDTITLDTLGIVVKDSFNNRLSDVTLTLTEGVQTAGQTLTYLVTATDHLGNVQTRTIDGIRIYGTPTISFDSEKTSMKVTDAVDANLLSAVAKDSHNENLPVTVTVESGTIAGGNVVKFRLSTVDALGNEYSVVTQDIKVYSSDNITLTYNASATTRMKKTSRGEEFGASAVNGFGESCAISIEAAAGYTLAGGNTINLYIVATDALGNTTKSALISSIKVYDTPTLTYAREYSYIQNSDSPYELYRLTDSFGAEVLFDVTIVSGSLDVNETIVYKITGTDRVGNVFEETRELVVLDTNESILELYKNGVKIGTQRVYKGSNYTLPKESNSNVAWYLGPLVLTDDNGASLVAWDKDSGGYILTTDYYTVSYNANGGEVSITSQLVNKGASYINPVPTRVGYTFAGWYNGSTLYSDGKWPTADNVTLTAKWTANIDTVYIVRHYKQNIDNNDYTVYETQNLRGASDSTITPSVKTYTGFTSPSAQSTTISADGSRVVNYYYTRNTYTLTVKTNTGATREFTLKYQANVDTAAAISRDGYTFGGYYTNVELSAKLTTMPAEATTVYTWWQEETKPTYFTYSGTTSITISGYSGGNNVVIPSYIGNNPVRTISAGAFKDKSITTVVVPDTVTSIGNGAFQGCNSLTSITLPFVGSSSKSVSSSNDASYKFGYIFGWSTSSSTGATYDGYGYYYYIPSSLKTVTITDATGISARAFYNCKNLTSIAVNSGITAIYDSAFYGCSSLTAFTIPTNTTSIGSYAFYNNTALATLNFNSKVTSIGNYAFYGTTSLKEMTLPSELTSIGSYAFNGTRVRTLTIPSKVTSIGSYAFANVATLTSLTIPGNVTDIGEGAFSGCGNITTLTLNSGIKTIGANAFKDFAITTVVVPDTVTSIGNGAFQGCNSLTSITLPFVGSSSKSVSSSNDASYKFGYIFGWSTSSSTGATYDGYGYYYYIPSSLKTVTITDATGISARAFYNCKNLTSIAVNSGITAIYDSAFYNCSAITSIVVPYGVTTMGANVFANCSSLNINCQIEEQPSTWTSTWNSSDRPVTWGYGIEKGTTTDGYKWMSIDGETVQIMGYEGTATMISIPSTISGKPVARIVANAFAGKTNLTRVEVPTSILYVEANAFTGCTNASILCKASAKPSGWVSTWNSSNRPVVWNYAGTNGVTSDGLKWATVNGDTVVIYGYSGSSTSVSIPTTINGKTVSGISENAFRSNTTITSVFIPTCIEYIGSGAFVGCTNLTINCEAASAPSGWSSSWKDSSTTVYWSM